MTMKKGGEPTSLVDNLRAALSLAEAERDAARGEVGLIRDQLLLNIFQEMNEERNGAILDVLSALAAREEAQAEDLPTYRQLVTTLIRYLGKLGLRPLEKTGVVEKATKSALRDQYRYFGRPLGPKERVRKIKVVTSGWALGDRVIVRPTVTEVE